MAALAALVLGGAAILNHTEVRELEAALAEAEVSSEKVDVLLASRDTTRVETALPGTPAKATVLFSQETDMAWVAVADLPPPPDGSGYQFWYMRDEEILYSPGMMEAVDDGRLLTMMCRSVGETTQFGISVEPMKGTAPEPSTSPMTFPVPLGEA